jgi:hypothetical protein
VGRGHRGGQRGRGIGDDRDVTHDNEGYRAGTA